MGDGYYSTGVERSSRTMPGFDLVALPKVQLHCHLEGTVRAETFRALAAKYGVELGERADPARTYAFATFGEFLLLFAKVSETLRGPKTSR
jgi:adenosine deaminase